MYHIMPLIPLTDTHGCLSIAATTLAIGMSMAVVIVAVATMARIRTQRQVIRAEFSRFTHLARYASWGYKLVSLLLCVPQQDQIGGQIAGLVGFGWVRISFCTGSWARRSVPSSR